jgi:hypothetical protein
MYLVLLCDIKGVPVGYDLAGPKTGQKRDAACEFAPAHPGSCLFTDGFGGAECERTMQLIDVSLITSAKHNEPGRVQHAP